MAVIAALMLCMPLVSQAQDADLEEINIELPEPFFGGTPIDYWSPNLEPLDYKDRPPFMAPKGASNVAKGKAVTSSVPPVHGELKQLTDGDKHYARTSLIELPDGAQWVQVDLEKECSIYAILLWHFHEGNRVYFDIVVQASNDKEFNENVTTVYNNDHDNSAGLGVGKDKEYQESYKGRLIEVEDLKARYLRFYSKGNTADDFNHYVEVEVYGK
ncbi:MAG: discoidin domain-containing protein [Candidatus Hydrogenedentes bacterium]|nr:discoidin domain-containing protein [Candidatus Hydrogenedentota bacterium]